MRFLNWATEHPIALVLIVFALGVLLNVALAVVFTALGVPWTWDLNHGVTPWIFVSGH